MKVGIIRDRIKILEDTASKLLKCANEMSSSGLERHIAGAALQGHEETV